MRWQRLRFALMEQNNPTHPNNSAKNGVGVIHEAAVLFWGFPVLSFLFGVPPE
jgi:hypothetical protein